MALLNIGEANQGDAFYRYKMPQLQAKIEGRGNGIKTNIVNMVDIAKALSRNPAYTTKYFGCELGAQSKFDDKTGTSIVNGAHDGGKLAQLLDGFIKRFVCCYACGNPETEIKVSKKREEITLVCKACGNVSKVDMRHKLATYILKNPPVDAKSSADKKLRRAEKERMKTGELIDEEEKARRRELKKKAKEDAKAVEKEERRKRREERKRLKEGGEAVTGEEESGGNGCDPNTNEEEDEGQGSSDDEEKVEWFTDTSAAAAAQRAQEQLSAETAKLVVVDEATQASKQESSVIVLAKKLKQECPGKNKEDIVGFLAASDLASVSMEEKLAAVLLLLLEPSESLPAQVKSHKKALEELVGEDPLRQLSLLQAVEYFIAQESPKAASEAALVFKVMYDEDLADERVIDHWYDKPDSASALGVSPEAAASIRKAAEPLVEWLRNADSEESDEA